MSTHPVFQAGNTALITGAASGIGLAVAKSCRKHGMKVALVDNNHDLLKEVVTANFMDDVSIKTYPMDVSNLNQWQDLKARVEMDFGQVSLVMLNAGTAPQGSWEDNVYFHKIMDTNLFGVINGINTFLPSLRSQKSPTAFVITGSKQGITNPPGNPAYNASKAAIKSLAEHLSYDLRSTPTSVHLLVPGWTYTGLTKQKGVSEKPAGAWSPEQVAEYLEKKMAIDTFYIICPDNDVDEETDRLRMKWSTGDIVEQRPPLSRWRDKFKEQSVEWMASQKN